jgi:hypothetical protein
MHIRRFKGQVMNQRVRPWRSGTERLWLAMLVNTMETISRPDFRAVPCDQALLAEVRAQLARPVSPYPYGVSEFSLRN